MFKKKKVVMLPTNEKAGLGFIGNSQLMRFNPNVDGKIEGVDFKHFYILSDEKIEKGDWCVNKNLDTLYQITNIGDYNPNKDWYKVIATTDSSLQWAIDKSPYSMEIHGLPQPSTAFIEKYIAEYNKGNIITKVMVEYENIYPESLPNHHKFILKVDNNNTITIRKVKDSWSREEVVELINKFETDTSPNRFEGYGTEQEDINEWIEQNL